MAAVKIDSECVSDYTRRDGLKQRAAKAIGAEDKKNGSFQEAFDWYMRAKSQTDAGCMQRKLVEGKPDDINRMSHAIDYFSRQNGKAQEQAMRAQALKNVEKAFTEEEKRFTSFTKDSLKELGLAKNWVYYAQAGDDRIHARAAKRGETLAAEDGRKFLNLPLSCYQVADQPDGIKKVREKALALAKRREPKGEDEIAAEHYAMDRRPYLAKRRS